MGMAQPVIHVSEEEAAKDFPALLVRVRAGAEVVIEHDSRPVAVVHPAEPSVRLLSESLRLAREHGSTATLDAGFAKDVEAVIESHREPLTIPFADLLIGATALLLGYSILTTNPRHFRLIPDLSVVQL